MTRCCPCCRAMLPDTNFAPRCTFCKSCRAKYTVEQLKRQALYGVVTRLSILGK